MAICLDLPNYACLYCFAIILFILANEFDECNKDEKSARASPHTFSFINYQPILQVCICYALLTSLWKTKSG